MTTAPPTPWKPRYNPWAIALTVTLATFMEILDTSIANVALPHIAGSLSASQDQATWVLTSYLVSNAIILPASAYFSSMLGRKRYYMTCVALFGISSLMCGMAPSLNLLLLFRVFQGIGGGGLAPSEQAILADTFEPKKRGQAFALYGMAVVAAPAIGPTLGGYITDNFNWRWIFFINIPVVLISLFLTHRLVEDSPQAIEDVRKTRAQGFHFDYIGFGLLALGFGSLEVVLDKGQEDDWFGSQFITTFTTLCVIGLLGLILYVLWRTRQGHGRPILDLRLFLNRNFAVSFVLMFTLGVALYGTTVLIPQLLQSLMGYTAELAGMAMSPGGLVTMACMPLVGFLIGKVEPRYLAAFGFAVTSLALFHMASVNLDMTFEYAASLRMIQAIGLAFLFVPINTVSYIGIKPEQNNDVSGLTNLARNVGGTVGTAIVTTMLARRAQAHQVLLTAHANVGSATFQARSTGLTQVFSRVTAGLPGAQSQAYGALYRQMLQHSAMLAYVDILYFFSVAAAFMVPLVFLLRRRPAGGGAVMAH